MEKQREENGRSPRKRIVNILVHVFLAVLAVIWVMPIFWIVLTSFRAEPGAYTSTFLPKAYTLNNYVKLLTDRNVLNRSCCLCRIRSAGCVSNSVNRI